MNISRRQMLKLSAGALLTANLWPGRLRAAQTATTDFTLVVVNDLHYFDENCGPFFEGLVKKINALERVDQILIVGDLVDQGTPSECAAIRDILNQLKAPYRVTPGNHDAITQTDRSPWEDTFGKQMNYTFDLAGWQFIALDTSDGQKAMNFDCHRETLDYAHDLAKKLDPSKPTILFTHFPLGPDVKYRLKNADALLEPFKPLNLHAIYNGHYHAFTEKTLNAIDITTNKCCSRYRNNHDKTPEKGFFVCDLHDATIKRRFIEYGTGVTTTSAPATTLTH